MANENTLAFCWHFVFGSVGNFAFTEVQSLVVKQQASL
jgi:hypothetical protein